MNIKTPVALCLVLLLAAAWMFLAPGTSGGHTPFDVAPRSAEDVGGSGAATVLAPPGSVVDTRDGREALVAVGAPGPLASGDAPRAIGAERDLLVRVLGVDGEPAFGESVVIVRGPLGRERWWLSAESEAPDGMARFVDYLGEQERDPSTTGGGAFAALDMVALDPPRVGLPRLGLPSEVPTLRVMPHAELIVRLVSEGGDAFPISDWVHVTPLRAVSTEGERVRRGGRASVYVENGFEAQFLRVTPGTRLRVQVTPLGILADVEQFVPPLTAGERRTIELVMGATDAHVVGRIVHPDGSAVAAMRFGVDLEPGRSAWVDGVGADGSFAMPLDHLSIKEGPFVGHIALDIAAPGGARSEERKLTGSFQGVVPLGGGAYDVGDVILRPPPTIAAGRVVDAAGVPVVDVTVTLYRKFNQGEDPEDFIWSYSRVARAYTDAAGRFDMKGALEPGEYALRVQFSDWVDRGAHRFQTGARGIELLVDRKRMVAGRLLLPDGVDPSLLEVRVWEVGASRERRAFVDWRTTADAAGHFILHGLRPEPVSASVHLLGVEAPLAEIHGVVPRIEPSDTIAELAPWELSRYATDPDAWAAAMESLRKSRH